MSMGNPDKRFSDLVEIVKSWIPRNSASANVSRNFWMPDQSCRVCYECDAQFTIFNRRHHCRHCGRIFCAKCTSNYVPFSSGDLKNVSEELECMRVCNFCFKQWEQEIATSKNGFQAASSPVLSPSLSTTSLASTKSSGTSFASVSHSTGVCKCVSYGSSPSPVHSIKLETSPDRHGMHVSVMNMDSNTNMGDPFPNQFELSTNRSDDDYEYGACRSDSETQSFHTSDVYYGPVDFGEADEGYRLDKAFPSEEHFDTKAAFSAACDSTGFHPSLGNDKIEEETKPHNTYECEVSSSIYGMESSDMEPDFEKNILLWHPPKPEDEEDERESVLFDDDDEDVTGEWGYRRSSDSFGRGVYQSRDQPNEEHKKIMKNVVDGHFRNLIAGLLQAENLTLGEEDDGENWLDIITALSWDAANLLKPDTSKGGGMDPGGYVKVKCLACGRRSESTVVKGVVCKKNIANRRMISKIEKPRFLILEGALEYQRVTNTLSSFDTLLQQEMDHLKMAVAKIDVHHPNVLLVEKSVSRFAQEYLLAKNISLVLNIKRPLLERIARCIGAQIVPSIDHISSQQLGHCDLFHVEKFYEDHGSAGYGGKKLIKTLMFFEGCPKPFGCTVLLKGANGDELKRVKNVVQLGVFAAYHLALETSFLADERASLPEASLKSPINVALPDKPSITEKGNISVIPNFKVPDAGKPQLSSDLQRSNISESEVLSISSSGYHPFGVRREKVAEGTEAGSLTTSYQTYSDVPDSPANCLDNFGTLNRDGVVGDDDQLKSRILTERKLDLPHLDVSDQEKKERDAFIISKEEFQPPPEHQSILVSLSSRCVWNSSVCERAHLFRIRYYSNFDKPLGRFLRDHLLDQNYQCFACNMPSEAHVHCYTHRQGSLTITVRKLPDFSLPGEQDGKIWMWHRCLRCPRVNGFPPITRRVVMSDAAWGLSFGKFLELSFSNHAAASRVASCGHSLHRDCLRFYGFGKMVACFRYSSVKLHSVYLPPSKLEFSYQHQEWIQKEANEVADSADLLFSEVLNALIQTSERWIKKDCNMNILESKRKVVVLEGILQKEKAEFELSLQKVVKKEAKKQELIIDILEVNKLRRQLLFQSYFWDQRLILAAGSDNSILEVLHSSLERNKDMLSSKESLADLNVAPRPEISLTSTGISSVDFKSAESLLQQRGDEHDPSRKKQNSLLTTRSFVGQLDPHESGLVIRRILSEGQFPMVADISTTLDAKWSGENSPTLTDGSKPSSSASVRVAPNMLAPQELSTDGTRSSTSSLVIKSKESQEDVSKLIEIPFVNFYHYVNMNSANDPLFDALCEYNPVYISSFRELDRQGGARLLLPIGVNDTVVPVYDDEPTSIIAYALVSPDYRCQVCDQEKIRDGGDSLVPSLSYDPGNFQPIQFVDETSIESYKSFGSTDDNTSSLFGSMNSIISDPFTHTKAMHVRVSFSDKGPLGKVKYTVICYYAKYFDSLRKNCCPSELDFLRSLSRCKKWGAQGGKSNVFFAKSLDDRFIIKQVTKTELESFIKFAPHYFKYLTESISTGSHTCLAKILGIFQVTTKHMKSGKETRMDVLVMENLLFGRNVTRLFDLKGSSRSRYNPDSSGANKVLLDQNLMELMPISPIFVGNKGKRLLERAVWNDTAFLASIDVMDYSLLVGVDEEKHELVLGIIDFMRQYTWDKHLETWVKASGILGGPKNVSPTVVSPMQYKKRFRKAMASYFLLLPDQWLPPDLTPNKSQSELREDI